MMGGGMTDEKLIQRDGETPLAYHKRLIYGKLVDHTLADYDYAELAPYMFGKEYSADVARRLAYGSRYALDLMDQETEKAAALKSGDSYMAELEDKKRELAMERQRFFDQRREYNRLVSADGRAEHLYEMLAEAANKLGEEIGVLYQANDSNAGMHSDNDAIIVFSDWHYGMTTNNVFNKYNVEICKERVDKVVFEMISRIELHDCRNVHIVVLGDLIHGCTHVSARVASEELVCEQIMHSAELLAQSIYEISKHACNTYVYVTYGNHARTVQNKKDNIHSDNLERIVPWWLMERFKDNPTVIIVPEDDNEFILIDVCGHDFCASHGDLETVNTSPRLLTTLFSKKYGKDIE